MQYGCGGDINVGMHELRHRLSGLPAHARADQTETVAHHGAPVARITPVGLPESLEQLVADGRVTPTKRPKQPAGRRVKLQAL